MSQPAANEPRTLLILDDDRPFRERLARAMQSRGFVVTIAETVREGIAIARENPPAYAVIDLKLEDGMHPNADGVGVMVGKALPVVERFLAKLNKTE